MNQFKPFDPLDPNPISQMTDEVDFDFVQDTLDRYKKAEEWQIEKENRPKFVPWNGPGMYVIKVLFAGNIQKNVPFTMYERHNYFEPEVKSQYKYRDTFCWHWLLKEHQLMQYLAERGKIYKQDLDQYQISGGGCPFCTTHAALRAAGVDVDKDTGKRNQKLNKIKKEVRYIYNIYFYGKELPNGKIDDSLAGFYIWEVGQQNHIAIAEPWKRAREAHKIDMMDLNKGHNVNVRIEGTGLLTRYKITWEPSPTPFAKELDIKRHEHLMTLKSRRYQECIDLIKREWGTYLSSINFSIPGDLSGSITVQLPDDKELEKSIITLPDEDDLPF